MHDVLRSSQIEDLTCLTLQNVLFTQKSQTNNDLEISWGFFAFSHVITLFATAHKKVQHVGKGKEN